MHSLYWLAYNCNSFFILGCWRRAERRQCVVFDGASSETSAVTSGVPQGSILGPLLFLIYIDDISQVNLSPGSKHVLYADDILLYRPISSVKWLSNAPGRHWCTKYLVYLELIPANVRPCQSLGRSVLISHPYPSQSMEPSLKLYPHLSI